MRYIDVFNHFMPAPLWQRMTEMSEAGGGIGGRVRGVKGIYDLDTRLKCVEQFADKNYSQVLCTSMPPPEMLGGPKEALELAKLGNDGLAELVAKHPHHFAGFAASLPMNDPDAACREAERCFKDLGANAIEIHSNMNGAPLDEARFFPIFETIAKHDKPILLHPIRGEEMPDYATESRSEYEIWWTFGWPYETSVAMARIVFSGMLDKLPNLKIVAHHMGAMVPYFAGRVGPGWDQLGKRTTDRDLGQVLQQLKRRPFDYFKDFYADTAVFGSRAATICGLDFYGADHVLFASDSPFDPEGGPATSARRSRCWNRSSCRPKIARKSRTRMRWRCSVSSDGAP